MVLLIFIKIVLKSVKCKYCSLIFNSKFELSTFLHFRILRYAEFMTLLSLIKGTVNMN